MGTRRATLAVTCRKSRDHFRIERVVAPDEQGGGGDLDQDGDQHGVERDIEHDQGQGRGREDGDGQQIEQLIEQDGRPRRGERQPGEPVEHGGAHDEHIGGLRHKQRRRAGGDAVEKERDRRSERAPG